MTPGDEVLLKNTQKSSKLSTNFEHAPYIVERKKGGNELTVQSQDGVVYKRNNLFVKPYITSDETTPAAATGEMAESNVADDAERLCSDTPTESQRVSTPPRKKPIRSIKIPGRYRDFSESDMSL